MLQGIIGEFTGSLAYSPDGRSLACASSGAIVIWDIQTGGVAKVIKLRGVRDSLVWSLDGRTIATTTRSTRGEVVLMCDVVSGVTLSLEVPGSPDLCNLWAGEKSFRLVETSHSISTNALDISISEIGPPLIETETLNVEMSASRWLYDVAAFSPTTHRVSILSSKSFCVLDIRNSDCLLEARGKFLSPEFSPDGNLLAAFCLDSTHIWKYTSGGYVLWGEPFLWNLPILFKTRALSLQFSPTSPSILIHRGNVLQVRRLPGPPATHQTRYQYAAISHSGCNIAIAHKSESTVTIINLHSQVASQSIDTGVEIQGLAITGNVLLVASSEAVLAWLLTEEGTVDGVLDNRGANRSNSIWTMSSPLLRSRVLSFRVEGRIGVVGIEGIFPLVYQTKTGDILDRAHEPQQFSSPWVSFYQPSDLREYFHLRHSGLTPPDSSPKGKGSRSEDDKFSSEDDDSSSKDDDPPSEDGNSSSEDNKYSPMEIVDDSPEDHHLPSKVADSSSGGSWLILPALVGEAGWVVDSQGRHRFWVPIEWRKSWERENWHHDITTLFTRVGDQPVVIKF